ncbi:MAG: hypothetical protein M0Q26_15320 [Chitinophagaceae bacterium]|nr:hypothetical protein [Chitinophagaceae bacterium]
MTNINTVIPSNCSDKWYCSFNNISTEHCKVHAFESINKKWIRLSMVYESTILFEKEYRKNWNIRNLSLNTPQILKDYQSLCDNVIFITELVPNVNIKAEIGKIRKNINFTFSIESINKDEHISEGFTSLFQKIEEETAMIIEEITAQGKYVQSVQSKAVKYSDDGAWYFDDSGMKCEVSEDAVFEYWGDLSFDTEIISNTSKYPWMPLNITPDDDIPF